MDTVGILGFRRNILALRGFIACGEALSNAIIELLVSNLT